MNIFEFYREYIIKILKNLSEDGSLSLPDSLDGINVDIPPLKFDCDLSSNAALILSKINNKKPNDVANLIISKLSNENNIESISVANPGFINIKLKKIFWSNFLTNVISNKNFGKNNKHKKKKYLIEFVSANPTGPLHVGHCRGAVLGDVLSNLLLFNENIVTKEYYVNDFGGQIKTFVLSVYYRILEQYSHSSCLQM